MNAADLFAVLWTLVLYNLPAVIAGALGVVVCFMLGCRIAKMMRGVTALGVFLQHAFLAIGVFGAVLLLFSGRSEWSPASAIAGVLIFLLLSLRRWRYAPPAGTVRAKPLDLSQLRHVHGGKRSDP